MNNVEGTQGVPLTVFGGAVPELAPEDLPEGASPFNQDCDFNPGSVFTRGGRVNQISYGGLSLSRICNLAQNGGPPGAAWATPTNAALGIPGTYATVSLNHSTVAANGILPFDTQVTGFQNLVTSNNISAGPVTPNFSNEIAFMVSAIPLAATGGSFVPSAGWSNFLVGLANGTGPIVSQILTSQAPLTGTGTFTGVPLMSATCMVTFRLAGPSLPTVVQWNGIISGSWTGNQGPLTPFGVTPVTAGNTLMIVFQSSESAGTNPGIIDNLGNPYTQVSHISNSTNGAFLQQTECAVWVAQNITGGVINFHTLNSGNSPTAAAYYVFELQAGALGAVTGNTAQLLEGLNFNFAIPAGLGVMGAQIEIDGHQSTLASDTSISVTVGNPTSPTTPTLTSQLPLVDGAVTFGTKTSSWGLALSPALLNNPLFQVNLAAQALTSDVTFNVYAIRVIVWLSPSPPANINYLRTYEQTNSQIDTLVLDSNGILWDENVTLNPTVLNSIFLGILPNTFAKSDTFADIEYIAFSNLLNGTDVPRQWNGTNLDRISMVGPGAAPTASSGGTGTGAGTIPIQQITQAPPVEIRRIAFGTVNSPADSTPGNLMVVYGEGRTPANPYQTLAPYTPSFGTGTTVVLNGIQNPFPLKGGGSLPYNINGTYQVGTVQQSNVGGAEYCPTFALPAPLTTWAYSSDFGSGGPPPTSNWWYQSAIATVTMQQPLPNVGPGSTIVISGTGTPYDGTWPVIQAPNSSQMTITSAQIIGNVATYGFTLAVGSSLPQPGQTVTITNVLNNQSQNPNANVFNVTTNINSVNDNTFSVAINSGDTGQQLQSGPTPSATVSGTIFTFDAKQIVNQGGLGQPSGAVNGGFIVQQGLLGIGLRKVCYSFLTRSGYITQPSPIYPFNITVGSSAITVSGLSIGPPNVVARIVSFTGANGGNFFYIPQDVTVSVGGVNQISRSTIVNDNTTTTYQFNFSDAVLLSATAIDIPGNNLFNTIELGSCRGLLTYASRMFAWGEQLKITNLRNLSFDGGFAGSVVQGQNATVPLGWTLDPTNGGGGSLQFSSPVFGWCYQISNTGGVQATWGMLTQQAYLDEFGVPIVQAATLYSVRITAAVSAPLASGNLIVDLFDIGSNVALGTFSLPLTSLTTTMQIFTGTLLTKVLQPVPKGLLIRIWAQNMPTGAIQIDRCEPFQTLVPVNTTALKGSYVNNQEAFDLQTGVCGPAQNMQPINGAGIMYDLLYALKERSWYSTFDNGVTEPNKWNWKEVSKKTGSIGQNSYDWGEGWMLSADREGVHFFEGGEPIKVSQEIQPLWDLINWQYGYTMWLRNDPEQRRFTVGVPIPTPNAWMPEFPANANPTSPNVILMCNYRELNTGAAIAQTSPIRSTYMGRLMSPEPARKWSFWSIRCPYSDYIDRNNNQWPQWFGTGYTDSKIFALAASALSDDGAAINSFWVSYGFVKPEMQDAKGMGLWRMEFPYLTVLATGSGTLNTFVYPESPFNLPPYDLDVLTLPGLTQGDLELGVNIKGNRFFIRVGTNAVGSAFRLSKLVVPLLPDTWSPVRGWNSVTA